MGGPRFSQDVLFVAVFVQIMFSSYWYLDFRSQKETAAEDTSVFERNVLPKKKVTSVFFLNSTKVVVFHKITARVLVS